MKKVRKAILLVGTILLTTGCNSKDNSTAEAMIQLELKTRDGMLTPKQVTQNLVYIGSICKSKGELDGTSSSTPEAIGVCKFIHKQLVDRGYARVLKSVQQ